MVLQSSIKLHSVSQCLPYIRSLATDRKNTPLLNAESILSLKSGIENLQKHPKQFNYSYLMMLGEYDDVVKNPMAETWHSKTPATLPDKRKIVFPKSSHQLHKEPHRDQVFCEILTWLDKRLKGK